MHAACKKAEDKLAKAKKTLKRLKQRDASKAFDHEGQEEGEEGEGRSPGEL